MRNYEGLTLVEMICSIAMASIVILGVASGVTALRNLQYRTDSITRLSFIAGGVIESWKTKPFEELRAGKFIVSLPKSKYNDEVTVTIKDTEDKNIKELKVEAVHKDSRHPLQVELVTLMAKE